MSDQLLSVTHVKACRKPGKCIWCGGAVSAGEPVVRRNAVWDGAFGSDSYHPECFAASCASDIEDGFEPYEFGRGRWDDRLCAPAQWDADGNRTAEPL
jgi:hypothetical protein